MPRGRVGRTVRRRPLETENASEDPSPSIRHLKPPDSSDFDAATKTIVDGASSDAKAVASAGRAAAAAGSDDGSESDIVDEIGHVSRVDATRSEAESIPEESLARDVDDLDATTASRLFSPSPRRRSSLGLSRRSVRGGDGETRRGAASTSRATTRRASRRSRDETREDSRDGGGTRATRGGRRRRRRLSRERRRFPTRSPRRRSWQREASRSAGSEPGSSGEIEEESLALEPGSPGSPTAEETAALAREAEDRDADGRLSAHEARVAKLEELVEGSGWRRSP